MKQILLGVLATALLSIGSAGQMFQDKAVIGFLGDSITHAEYAEINYTHVLYNYYVTHASETEVEIRNLGIGGIRVSEAMEVYEQDPACEGLDSVILEYGMNDLRMYLYEDPDAYETNEAERTEALEEYQENLLLFLEKLENDGIEKDNILLTTLAHPCTVGSEGDIEGMDGSMARTQQGFQSLAALTREIAEDKDIGLVEFQKPLQSLAEQLLENGSSAAALLQEDYLHPSTAAQIYLAYLFLEQTDSLEDVSNVEIQEGHLHSEDAHVSNLHSGDGFLYYDYRAERLPLGISSEYREADESLHILDTLNREIIQVADLEADAIYDIYMNGEKIASPTGAELAEGFNIANLSENPAQQWARAIEDMNRGRRTAELAYRKKVQDSTDCGSGEVTAAELQEAYESWQKEDAEYRNNMYELTQEAIKITRRVAIVKQGVEAPQAAFEAPGHSHEKLLLLALPVGCFLAIALVFWKKRKRPA